MPDLTSALRKVWQVTALVVLLTLIFIVFVGFVVAVAYPANVELDASQSAAALRVSLALVAGLVSLAVIYAAFQLFRLIATVSRKTGAGVTGNLLGLAIASLLFRDGVVSIFGRPIWFGLQAIAGAFRSALFLGDEVATAVPVAQVLSGVASGTAKILSGIFESAFDFISAVSITNVVFALAVWILGASLFVAASDSATGTSRSRVAVWWSSLEEGRRRLLGTMALLACGTYLSVAAIIAIPWLLGDETDTQNLTKDRLQAQLERDSVATPKPGAVGSDSMRMNEAMKQLRTLVAGAKVRIAGRQDEGINLWHSFLDDAENSADRVEREYRQAVQDAGAQMVRLERRLQKPKADAVTAFENNATKQMTATERSAYYQSLFNWARNEAEYTASEMTSLTEAMQFQTLAITQWAADVRGRLQQLQPVESSQGGRTAALSVSFDAPGYLPVTPSFPYALTRRLASVTPVPDPPEPGLGWGPFAVVAQWLLRTKSVPLAQIAGMLGFGLFGAAVSVLRWRDKRATSALGDTSAILVNGFSATLVVFLAVNGGLAIISQGQPKPNSYVLFFACVVGAVFSEDVWIWARERLGTVLTRTGETPAGEAGKEAKGKPVSAEGLDQTAMGQKGQTKGRGGS